MNSSNDAWWKPFYDDLLADMLLENSTPGEISETVDFLTKALNVLPGQRVLDQCCGSGRLTVAMAARGLVMTGIDLAPNYIKRAGAKADAANFAIHLEVADAFEFIAKPPCRAVFNWWTSFGYADADATNLQMLKRAWDSLEDGGRFALDFMNVPGLYRHFQSQVITRGRNAQGEILLIRESRLDLARGRILKEWTYVLPDGKRVQHETSVRLYDPPALNRLFTEAGFTKIEMFGDTLGRPLALESPRCVVVGQKP